MSDPRNTDFLRQHARVAQRVSNIETGVHPVKADVPYEDVGTPIDDGGGDALDGYLHYGGNPHGAVNPSGTAQIEGTVHVLGSLQVDDTGSSSALTVNTSGVHINTADITGDLMQVYVTNIGMTAQFIIIEGAISVVIKGDVLQLQPAAILMPNLGSSPGDPGQLYIGPGGFLKIS